MEAVADNADARPLGQVLAQERERQGLSRSEIAQRLHMSAWQIEALEAGDYSRLPKGTFLRGFVRNYAKALGIDPKAVLTRLAEAAPRGPAPGIVVPSQNIRFDPMHERFSNPYWKAAALAFVAIAMGFAGMYWWLFIKPTPPAGAAKRPGPVEPAPKQVAVAPVSAPQAPAPSSAPIEMSPPKIEAVKNEPPKKVEPQKPGSQGSEKQIKFRFKGEAWVEIKDRSGRVLLSRLNAPGSEAEVSGRPPFTVVVGNAPDVEMTLNDKSFDLEPHTRVAVARFTVE